MWLCHQHLNIPATVLRHASLLQIDEQDAKERAELRRKQIEAANKMLYDDTDRPKKLHSKMLLSDVLQERVAQMGYVQQIKALKHNQDAAFLVQQAARLKVITPHVQTCKAIRSCMNVCQSGYGSSHAWSPDISAGGIITLQLGPHDAYTHHNNVYTDNDMA